MRCPNVIHRLNARSRLFQVWSRGHWVSLENPVKRGVRPPMPDGRDRRLRDGEEDALLARAGTSSRPWLQAAIIIAIETCIRQSELARLVWGRVRPEAEYPYIDRLKTENDRPRRAALSMRAVEAFRSLLPSDGCPVLGSVRVIPVETGRGIAHAFRDVITDREFPDLRWHDLRHEAISRLFELTDLRNHEIMSITGHPTPAMLARCTHLRSDRLAARLPKGAAQSPVIGVSCGRFTLTFQYRLGRCESQFRADCDANEHDPIRSHTVIAMPR